MGCHGINNVEDHPHNLQQIAEWDQIYWLDFFGKKLVNAQFESASIIWGKNVSSSPTLHSIGFLATILERLNTQKLLCQNYEAVQKQGSTPFALRAEGAVLRK